MAVTLRDVRLTPSPAVFGGGSIQLARVFGIRIGVDFSWFFVLFLIIWSLSGYYEDVAPGSNAFVLAVLSALLFFLSILLHELGHAWVADPQRHPDRGHRPVDVRRGGEARKGRGLGRRRVPDRGRRAAGDRC